ncbi:E3 ubiquitin-protein ligase SDIR1-like [Magnolia sinica]|uniref:E3 ubiquitin-protein ligase SDIR1-like n=1 Tax=Magnolia sinica TaxID=86752 RepID=UPI0026585507|nr:E3 ubiquitin-protein ligase SDIR1-like [Magnolia sinica]
MSFVEEVSNTSSHDEFDLSVTVEDEFDMLDAVEDDLFVPIVDEFNMLADNSDTLSDNELHVPVDESSYVLKECCRRLDVWGHPSVPDMEVCRVVKMWEKLQCFLQVEISKARIAGMVSHMDIPLTCVESVAVKINDMAKKAHQVGKKTLYIVAEIEVLILVKEDEDGEETLAAALRESIDDMAYQRTSAVPTSKYSIEALERMTFNKGKYDEIKCAICLNDFSTGMEVIRMPCSHVFDSECIIQWLEKNHVCPICRFEMPPQQFEEI